MVVIANDETRLQEVPENQTGEDRDHERNSPVIDSKNPLRRSAFRAMVQDFGPIWYVLTFGNLLLVKLLIEQILIIIF
jgi:hypothetical protein